MPATAYSTGPLNRECAMGEAESRTLLPAMIAEVASGALSL